MQEIIQLDRNSKVPLYRQLYFTLKNQITEEILVDGSVFYSEYRLQEMYQVSKITVRGAMQLLEDEGYISRSQGSLTTVTNRGKYWWNLTDFTHDLKSSTGVLSSDIIRIDKIKAPAITHLPLGLKEDSFVYCIERVRKIDEMRITHSISYLSPWLKLSEEDLEFNEKTSIYDILIKNGHIPTICDETIESVIAPEKTCSALQIPIGSPSFYRERTTFDQNHKPIEFVISYYNSQHTKYYVRDRIL